MLRRLLLLALVLPLLPLGASGAALAGAAAAPGAARPWVTVSVADQPLRRGCKRYRFEYRVSVPGDSWMVELFLRGPGGKRLASSWLESGIRADRGSGGWKICDSTTRPGRHQVRIRVTSYDGPLDREETRRREPSAYFVLSR